MLKQLYKILFVSSLICLLSIGTPVLAQTDTMEETAKTDEMTLIQNDMRVKDIDIEPLNTQKVKKNIIPDTKKEGKTIFSLFLKTISLVVICAIFLYVVLIFIKKYNRSAFMSNDEEEFEDLDLSTPLNREGALKSFLSRTK